MRSPLQWLPDDPREPIDVVALPYAERQTVMVVSDSEAVRIRTALLHFREQPIWDSGSRVEDALSPIADNEDASIATGIVLASTMLPARLALYRGAGRLLRRYGRAGIRAFRAWRDSRVPHVPISFGEASLLDWPKGDPVRGVIYAGSPAVPGTYYPATSFHTDILFERYGELREVLSRLGAKRITARVLRGRDLGGGGAIEVPAGPRQAAVAASHSKSERAVREDVQVLRPCDPVPRPALEDGLSWFLRERDWQRLANRRYEGRSIREELRFRQTDDFGLNANFAAAVDALPRQVKSNASYSKFIETVWEIEAEFEPSPRGQVNPSG